jgi:exportin-7
MPNVIHFMMISILEVVMLSEPDNLWSLSRPLLPLVLIDQAFFQQYVNALCTNQPVEKQKMLNDQFVALMDGVELNVTSKNRDKFTQNLQTFRRELNSENILFN